MFGKSILEELPDWVINPLREIAQKYPYFEDWFDISFPTIANAIGHSLFDLGAVPEIAYHLGIKKARNADNRALLKCVAFFEKNCEESWLTDLVVLIEFGRIRDTALVLLDHGYTDCHCHFGIEPNCPLQKEIRAEFCRRN